MNYTEVHAFISKVREQNIPLNRVIRGIYEYGTTEEFDTLAHLIKKGLEYYERVEEDDDERFQNIMAGNF